MINDAVKNEIKNRLSKAEKEHDISILYAVESGSRAWGFESPNSDYDVRFVYAHNRDWYLSVNEGRDVVEYPIVDDIDLSGWDVRKALRLLTKSNPSLIEWLQSPIVYRCDDYFAPKLRALLSFHYSGTRGIHHYRSMAKTNFRGYLRQETVPLKKYFYVLRPLLAARWVEETGSVPPIEFSRLLAMVADEADLLREIDLLLQRKRISLEKEYIPVVNRLNDFIESEIERLENTAEIGSNHYDRENLDLLFREIVDGKMQEVA